MRLLLACVALFLAPAAARGQILSAERPNGARRGHPLRDLRFALRPLFERLTACCGQWTLFGRARRPALLLQTVTGKAIYALAILALPMTALLRPERRLVMAFIEPEALARATGLAIHPPVKLLAAILLAGLLSAQSPDPAAWRPLFDGKTLAHWRESDFFGAGKVSVENQEITLGYGALTGITWADPSLPFPAAGYELRLDAMRVKGSDFFAGITFPVRDSHCTWIVGGWGGDVVGLSSIDHNDAARNETSFNQKFDLGRWYALRLRVTPDRISAWIDGDLVIDLPIANRTVSLREGEIEHSVPLGIASYSTVARLRRIEWRPATAPK